MSTLDEEKKRKIAERRAAAAKAQQNLDKYGISATELTNKSSASPVSGSKPATTKQEYAKQANEAAAAIKGTARVADANDYRDWLAQPKVPSGYIKKNAGDNDMNVVQSMYRKEEVDPASMTLDQAMGFATRIVDDKERDSFLKLYRKSAGNKRSANYVEDLPTLDEMRAQLNAQKPGGIYQKAGKEYSKGIKEQFARDYKNIKNMKVLGGLYDANGNEINANTADFATVVQGIRSIVDSDKRNAAIASLKELTKTEGSRFYGQTIDEKLLKSYLGSPEFSEDDYSNVVKRFENAFYPQDGYDEQNVEAYFGFVDRIKNGGYPEQAQRQMLEKLDEVYKNSTGKDIPVRTETEEAPAEEKEKEDKPSLLDKAGDFLGGIVDAITEPFTREPNRPEAYKEDELPGDAQEVGKTASATVSDSISAPAQPGYIPNLTPPDPVAMINAGIGVKPETQGPKQQTVDPTAQQPEMTAPEALQAYKKGIKLSEANLAKIAKYLDNPNISSGLLLATYETGAQAIHAQTVDENGNPLTLAQRNQNVANAEHLRYGKLGVTLASAAAGLDNGAVPEDMAALGQLMLGDVMMAIESRVEMGILTIPQGKNMYEYALSLDEGLRQQVEQVKNLPKVINDIKTENTVQQRLNEQKALEDAYTASATGNASDTQIAMLADQPGMDDIDVNDDELRIFFRHRLDNLSSLWYQDDGVFWRGDTAAAQEGQRLLKTGSGLGYNEYKYELKREAEAVIDDYTRVALSHNMSLEDYLALSGMELEDIMDVAYNRMTAMGAQILNDPEAPAAITAATQVESVGYGAAAAMGAAHGVVSYAEGFMNAPYQVIDIATYESRRESLMEEYVDKYQAKAPEMYRRDLEAYANSGALDKESTEALKANISRASNIFDVAYDIDPSFLAGLYRESMEGLGKTLDELEASAAYMPESERLVFNAASGLTNNLTAMGVSTLTGGVVSRLGAGARAASIVGTTMGYGLTEFDASYEDYKAKGLSDQMAAWMAFGKTAGTVAINVGGTGSSIDLYFGGSSAKLGYAAAMRGKGAVGLVTEMGKQLGKKALEEGGEEITETLYGYGYDQLDGIAMDIDQGKKVAMSTGIASVVNAFKSTDVKELGKEILTSGLAGAVYGGIFSLGSIAIGAIKGAKQVRLERQYNSINLSGQIIRGELKPTDENLARVVRALKVDVNDPKFRRAIDSADAAALEVQNVATAAMSGVGNDLRNEALELNKQAAEYDRKAEQATESVAKNQSEYLKARKEALMGSLEATKKLDGLRIAWAEAGTALEEATNAAKKARAEAGLKTAEWIVACRQEAGKMSAQQMQDATNQVLTARNAAAEQIVAQADARLPELGGEDAQAEEILSEPIEPAATEAAEETEPAVEAEAIAANAEITRIDSEIAAAQEMLEGASEEDAAYLNDEIAELQAQRDERAAIITEPITEPDAQEDAPAYTEEGAPAYTDADAPPVEADTPPYVGIDPVVEARIERARQVVAANKTKLDTGEEIQANLIGGDAATQNMPADTGDAPIIATPTRGRARKNPIQVFKRLANDLRVGQAFGTRKLNGLEGEATGYYALHSGHAATGTDYASDVESLGHEMGHAVAAQLGITGTDAMAARLPARFGQSYDAGDLNAEAFAHFFWQYLINDNEAAAFASPGFIRQFERQLRRNGMLRSVRRAQTDLRRYFNATTEERFRLMTRDKSDTATEGSIGSKLMDVERHIISAMVDSTRPAEDVNDAVREAQGGGALAEEDNLRHAALMQNHATKRAAGVLNDFLTDVNGTIIGDSLRTRLERAGLRGRDFDTFIAYMLAKHSIDRDAQSRLVVDRRAVTTADTNAFIRDIEQNRPEIRRAAEAFQSFRHDFMMAYMVNTGFMTQADLALFESMYPNYVPTYRVKDRGGRGVRGNTYRVMQATGSTEEIINPMDSFVDMVNSIMAMNLRNETYKTWDRVYHQNPGLGIFGRLVTEDERTERMDMRSVQDQVRNILNRAGAATDVVADVLDAIGETQYRRHGEGTVNLPNTITVQMPDGSTRFYEIFDQELFNMFEGTPDHGKGVLDYTIGPLTNFMTMMTTGSNPVFGIRNALRDFQNSVNYGSWAATYGDAAFKWLNAAWDVFRDGWVGQHTGLSRRNDTFEQYKALGGGGWTRVETRTKKGAAAYRGDLVEGYSTSNIGRTAKWVGKKIWNAITLSRLNEIIEQTSRYAEYKYGTHDLTTVEGRREAFLASQDVTTDFSRRGNSAAARQIKALVPFFNASLQGIYRTGRQFTEGEATPASIRVMGHEMQTPFTEPQVRFMKTVINTGLTSALASLIMIKHLDDEDKEEFFYLSDDLKAKHMYIPNFAPDILGEAPLIRIPLNQDPLSYAIHAAVTNAAWSGEGEEWAIELCAAADNILNSLNPVSSTTLDPLIATQTNKNWYGSNIVPRSMDGETATNQYSAETPEMFKWASHAIYKATNRKVGISPMMLQYIAEQYTGFVGQMVIPFFSKNEFTGEINGIDAVIEDVRKTLVSDPLKSNDIVSTVYDNVELLTEVTKAGKKGKPLDVLRGGLTQAEARRAYDEAYDMTHKGGVLYEAKQSITDLYAKIDEIEARTELSDEEKYTLQSEVRREMIEIALDANEAMAEFREKYIDGESFLTRFMKGTVIE